jgi:putative FmdB family regulatory protein
MPVYEYECAVCGMRFSHRRSYGGPDPAACPNGHEEIQRVFVAPAVIFKGSGFYVTDHARNGRVQSGASKTDDSEAAPDKEEAKTAAKAGDAKPGDTKPRDVKQGDKT